MKTNKQTKIIRFVSLVALILKKSVNPAESIKPA